MSTLADHLRRRMLDDVQKLSASERVELALALGDDDLRLYCAASGLDHETARQRIAATRQVGRRRSACATVP